MTSAPQTIEEKEKNKETLPWGVFLHEFWKILKEYKKFYFKIIAFIILIAVLDLLSPYFEALD